MSIFSGVNNPGVVLTVNAATLFTDLLDVPNSYSGQANKFVAVNSGATGLTFVSGGGGGTPAAPDTSIQFNDGGSFGGSASLVFDKNTGAVSINASPGASNALFVNYNENIDQEYPNGLFYNVAATNTSGNLGDVTGVFGQVVSGNTGVADRFIGNWSQVSVSTHTVTDAIGFKAHLQDLANATNAIGLSVDDISGAANNYAIKTGAGKVQLGDTLQLMDISSGKSAILDTSLLSSTDKTFTFPNKSGTFALTSDIIGFQSIASGSVNGSNTVFTWTVAPNVIVVDQGRVMQKISSDLTVNWTGTTTTTLSIAPNSDIYAIA